MNIPPITFLFFSLFHYSEMDNTYAHKMWVGDVELVRWMGGRSGKNKEEGVRKMEKVGTEMENR